MNLRRPHLSAAAILAALLALALMPAACSKSDDDSVTLTGVRTAGGGTPEAASSRGESPAPGSDVDRSRRVDIGGYEMRYLLEGKGTPAVVLDTGLGNSLEVWNAVEPEITSLTQMLAYDRLGLGFSDPGPKPRSARQIARELHLLLEKLEVPPPYVLVGHSTGGFHIRLFAEMYPDEVAGIVFVHANHEDLQDRREAMMGPEAWSQYIAALDRFFTGAPEGTAAEWEAYQVSRKEAREAADLPEVPVAVVTGMLVTEESESRGIDDTVAALQYELQHQWVTAVGDDGTHFVSEKSGSNVPVEDPAIVAKAIRQVVETVRKR